MPTSIMRLATLVPTVLRRSYLRKFLLVLLVVAGVMGGFGLYVSDMVGQEVRADAHAELEMVATLEAEELSSWMDGYTQTARMLSEYEDIRTGDPETIDEALETEKDNLPSEVLAIHYVKPSNRKIVRSTDGVIETKSVSDLDVSWTTGALTMYDPDGVAISEVYRYGGGERLAFLSHGGPPRRESFVTHLTTVSRVKHTQSHLLLRPTGRFRRRRRTRSRTVSRERRQSSRSSATGDVRTT